MSDNYVNESSNIDNYTINYNEAIVSSIGGQDIIFTANLLAYNDEVYTLNYINNLYDVLQTTCGLYSGIIAQATSYFDGLKKTQSDVRMPELFNLNYVFYGDAGSNAVVNSSETVYTTTDRDKTLTTLAALAGVSIIGAEDGMYKVKLDDGSIGYILKDNVDTSAGLVSKDITDDNSKLKNIETSGEKSGGSSGKRHSSGGSSSKGDSDTPVEEPTTPPQTDPETGNDPELPTSIKVYPNADMTGEPIELKDGEDVQIIGIENDMFKISYGDGTVGFVSKEYISVPDLQAQGVVSLSGSDESLGLKVYSASTDTTNIENVVALLDNETSVKVIGEENSMYKVIYGENEIGYVGKDYVKLTGTLDPADIPVIAPSQSVDTPVPESETTVDTPDDAITPEIEDFDADSNVEVPDDTTPEIVVPDDSVETDIPENIPSDEIPDDSSADDIMQDIDWDDSSVDFGDEEANNDNI